MVTSISRFENKRGIAIFLLIFSFLSPSFSQGAEAKDELRKVVSALVGKDVIESHIDLSLSGSGVDARPNMPRNGKLTVATNGKGERKLALNIPYGGQSFDVCLSTAKDVIYFYLHGNKDLAYFFDTKDKESAKKSPMIAGVAGVAQNMTAVDKEKKIDEAMKKFDQKGSSVKLISDGHLLITNPKQNANAFNLYYDVKTYLPQKINIYFADKKATLAGRFTKWITSGAVDTKLPVPVSQYQPFEMNKVGEIMQAAPKPQELLSEKPVPGVTPAAGNLSAPMQAHVGHLAVAPAHVPSGLQAGPGQVIVPKAEYEEMKQTIAELKSTLKVLQDPQFQRSLAEASRRIEKLEAQLNKFQR